MRNETILVQQIITKNDTYGNPRRLYILYKSDGTIIEVLHKGYRGIAVISDYLSENSIYSNLFFISDINVAPKEFKRLLKLGA